MTALPMTRIEGYLVGGLLAISVGALVAGQIQNTQEITKVVNRPAQVITKTIVVTPTTVPTATPSALLRTRISTPAAVTKGVR